jgi:hypothetical protein
VCWCEKQIIPVCSGAGGWNHCQWAAPLWSWQRPLLCRLLVAQLERSVGRSHRLAGLDEMVGVALRRPAAIGRPTRGRQLRSQAPARSQLPRPTGSCSASLRPWAFNPRSKQKAHESSHIIYNEISNRITYSKKFLVKVAHWHNFFIYEIPVPEIVFAVLNSQELTRTEQLKISCRAKKKSAWLRRWDHGFNIHRKDVDMYDGRPGRKN